MGITRIGPDDWESLRDVRLTSLSESPAAFGARYADWVDAPAERWKSRLTQVPLTLLAQEGNTVIGVVSAYPVEQKWVELISMWVAPTARGRGVARQLIDAVATWAAGEDRSTYLMVRRDNAPARRAYERAGFSTRGSQTGGRLMSLPSTGWNSQPDVTALDSDAVGIGTAVRNHTMMCP